MINLETLRFGNGAGTIKRLDEVERACQSAMTDITVGSITVEERAGNSGEVYYFHPVERWSLNSLGLPNPGLPAYMQILPEMRKRAHAAGKILRVSVAGFSPKEYALLAEQCFECGADEVELNLGCPNVWGEEGQKPIASYHPELVAAILEEVGRSVAPREVALKISPVEDPATLGSLADVFFESFLISHIVATNTMPNQERMREDGNPAINFNDGNHKGGLAGAPLLNKARHTINELRSRLPDTPIMAVGGIFSGEDAASYLANAPEVMGFQCATAYIEYGPRLFSEILEELSEYA